ncbi:hypothetical protein MLD38_005611 [Melastoma candidum]|uniref:Uncharacterized protein n=1 Tax=Melastoma candidum TaxID=119954 RepID=A0ACB9RPC7_9MYRT|nr:hypothetical protein MLD38_005611 [Melastoma candidum]
MGSIGQNKPPVIDFSEVVGKPRSAEWVTAREQVRDALIKYGCFEATFDGVPMDTRKALLGSLKELFDLPLETKLRNSSDKPFCGYNGPSHRAPLNESIGIDDADVYNKVDGISMTNWQEGNPEFSRTIHSFSEKLSLLDRIVRRMILESLGLEKYMEEHLNSTTYALRLMKYNGPQTTDMKMGVCSHTDKNMLTILYQNKVEGLEVKLKDGDWISIKPKPECFIAMVGESLYAWTNGRLHCPLHRVMMTGNDARYSVGLFSNPKAGQMIKAPDEMVDDDHPLLFKPFDYNQFIESYASQPNRDPETSLKAYCGI